MKVGQTITFTPDFIANWRLYQGVVVKLDTDCTLVEFTGTKNPDFKWKWWVQNKVILSEDMT